MTTGVGKQNAAATRLLKTSETRGTLEPEDVGQSLYCHARRSIRLCEVSTLRGTRP